MNANGGARRNILTIDPLDKLEVLRGLSSPIRIKILRLLHSNGPMNVNEISKRLKLPQSTIATNIQILKDSGLIHTETIKASKGRCQRRSNSRPPWRRKSRPVAARDVPAWQGARSSPLPCRRRAGGRLCRGNFPGLGIDCDVGIRSGLGDPGAPAAASGLRQPVTFAVQR